MTITPSSSVAVYDRVASGELTPEQGAQLLVSRHSTPLSKPSWMPRWAWIGGVVLLAIVFAPIFAPKNNNG